MRAVIFSNGVIHEPENIESLLNKDDFLIAADGGLRFLLELKILPHVLIGDMDSVTDENSQAVAREGVEILRFPAQKDETDLELAIAEAQKRGFTQILIVGALGGRLDQTLANLSLLINNPDSGLKITLDDGHEKVSLVEDRIEVVGEKGDIVSLIPYCGPVAGITTKGLAYPLEDETLYPENTRGISNVMVS